MFSLFEREGNVIARGAEGPDGINQGPKHYKPLGNFIVKVITAIVARGAKGPVNWPLGREGLTWTDRQTDRQTDRYFQINAKEPIYIVSN